MRQPLNGGMRIGTNDMTASQIIKRRRNDLEIREGYISLLKKVLFLLLVGWLLLSQVLLLTQAHGNAMFPAIKDGDLIIGFRMQSDYIKNDVVVYTAEGERMVGRVVARETDVVIMDDSGALLVNGTTQTGEILYPTYAKESINYPYEVPEGCVFVLCDYRTTGTDSRDFGAIPLRSVEGKVITILRRRGL